MTHLWTTCKKTSPLDTPREVCAAIPSLVSPPLFLWFLLNISFLAPLFLPLRMHGKKKILVSRRNSGVTDSLEAIRSTENGMNVAVTRRGKGKEGKVKFRICLHAYVRMAAFGFGLRRNGICWCAGRCTVKAAVRDSAILKHVRLSRHYAPNSHCNDDDTSSHELIQMFGTFFLKFQWLHGHP